MRNVVTLFFVFLGLSLFSGQNSVSGVILTEENLPLGKVLIINMKTNQKTYSDEVGNFQISAQISDEIRLVRESYDRISFRVKPADFGQKLSFQMKRTEKQIEAVEIISKQKIAEINKHIGVPNGVKSRPKAYSSKDIIKGVGLNLDAVDQLINGDARRRKNLYKYEDTQEIIEKIRVLLREDYFIEKQIPEERISELLWYSVSVRAELKSLAKSNNIPQIKRVLEQTMVVYRGRLKQN